MIHTLNNVPDDGTTDTHTHIQSILNSMQPGDVLLGADDARTYRITEGLVHSVPHTTLDFRGSTLLLDTSAYPYNTHLTITSQPNRAWNHPFYVWDEDIQAGPYALPCEAGDENQWRWLNLGTDPWDSNEEDVGMFVPPGVKAVDIPHRIRSGAQQHKLFSLPSPDGTICENVVVRNLNIATMPGKVADANVWVDKAKHIRIDGVTGEATIGVQVTDSTNVNVDNVTMTLTHTHPAAGRIIGAWNAKNVLFNNIKGYGGPNLPQGGSRFAFFERGCENIMVNNAHVRLETPGQGWGTNGPLFMVTGACKNVSIPYLTVYDESNVYLWDRGGQMGQEFPKFGTVIIEHGNTVELDEWVRMNWVDIQRIIKLD